MAAARTFEDKRARLRALASAPPPDAEAELRKMLGEKNGYLVGEAAEVIKKLELSSLTAELSAAFFRLLEDPVKNDKGCFGKNRVAEALVAFDAYAPDVYLKGLRTRQMEPAFGPPIDTAAGLRGLCAHALIHINHPRALLDVTPLLMDPEPITRAEAAAALGESGQDGAAAALHLKAMAGDKEPDVLGAAYKALLRIAPERYLELVTSAVLGDDEGQVEAAALALGESRPAGALEALKRAVAVQSRRRASDGVLLGIALLRADEANDYLISLVLRGSEGEAIGAVSALALHRHDQALVKKVSDAVSTRKSRKVEEVFDNKFLTR